MLVTVFEIKRKGKWTHFGSEQATKEGGILAKTLKSLGRKYRTHHEQQ